MAATDEFRQARNYLVSISTVAEVSFAQFVEAKDHIERVSRMDVFHRGTSVRAIQSLCHRACLYERGSYHWLFIQLLLLETLCGFLRKNFSRSIRFVMTIRKTDRMWVYRILSRTDGILGSQEPECPLKGWIMDRITRRREEVCDLYYAKFHPRYALMRCKKNLEVYMEELMKATWHPSRVQWWMSEDEKQEIFGSENVPG